MPTKKSTTTKTEVPKLSYYDTVSHHLSKLGRINILGVIGQEAYAHVENALLYLTTKYPGKLVDIHLNSPGGSVVQGLALYDAIMRYKKVSPIHITVEGAAMSMGVPILQAGTKRFATEHSMFLLHEVSYDVRGTLTNHDDEAKEAKRLQSIVDKILIGRSNITQVELNKLTSRKDYGFSAAEALKHNLIDAII